ncbi:MAG TPA: alkene reductase [Bacteroidales bacterium]|nr:alkene reductase [Bacteroidales bacterium]
MSNSSLFSSYTLGDVTLKNRIAMSPMTRSRAIDNVPADISAEYYAQRAGAGLIITEGTSPSPNGLGYCRIPGLYSTKQVNGWKKVTDAVHDKGGVIFVQLMHTGRVSHPLNLPVGARVLAPSAVKPAGKMYTDTGGLLDFPVPKEMSYEEVLEARDEYVFSATKAIEAGFDGVELHGANGYLLEQFLSPRTNLRTDSYGGSIENRCRFVLEVAERVANAIGKERLGIRLSPYGVASDMAYYPEVDAEYTYLAEQLNDIGIAYLHIADHSAMGAPEVPVSIKRMFRQKFDQTLILSGGYTKEKAEEDIDAGNADLIGFAKMFISNPDLVERFRNNWPLNANLDTSTFYTPGPKGYTDYPTHKVETMQV